MMPPIVPVVILGALGFVAWRMWGGSMSGSGWSARSGVVLPERIHPWLDRLAAEVGFDLVVTSALRTPEAQARAMSGLVRAGTDRDEMERLYGRSSAIRELLAVAWSPLPGATWNESTAVQILRAQVARGVYLSRHMRGDAVDISVSGLSEAQIAAVMSAARRLGADALREYEPPHIHLQRVIS